MYIKKSDHCNSKKKFNNKAGNTGVNMLRVTQEAENALKELAQEQGTTPVFQIMVMGFGWGGPSVGLVQAFDSVNPEHLSQEIQGVKIVWDRKVDQMTQYYGSLIVDYVKFFTKGRFVVAFDRASSC